MQQAILHLLLLLAIVLPSTLSATLKIGWASRDISTTEPVNIPGQMYKRTSQGILDPLDTTALVIRNNSDVLIFVSVDTLSIQPHLLHKIRHQTNASNQEIPVEKIVLHATHTHSGASHEINKSTSEQSTLNKNYADFIAGQIVEAIVEAYTTAKTGGVAYGYGLAVVGHCRRSVYFDDTSQRPEQAFNIGSVMNGHAKMYGSSAERLFSHFETGSEPFINLLYTFDEQKNLTGAIINVPAPSQCSETISQLSADYWHNVREKIREQHKDIFILPQCAAAGDMAPRVQHYKKAQARRFSLKYNDSTKNKSTADHERNEIAERIADVFNEVLEWSKREIYTNLPIKHSVKKVELSRFMISDNEAAKLKIIQGLADSYLAAGNAPSNIKISGDLSIEIIKQHLDQIMIKFDNQESNPTHPVELHIARLGDIAFVTNPFELFVDYMHRVQGRSPFTQTFVIQLTANPYNTTGTYLATERAEQNRGYSAVHFTNTISAKGGQEWVEESVKELHKLSKTPKGN